MVQNSNDSNVKLAGKVYSLVFAVFTSIFTLPMLLCLSEVFVCSIFKQNSNNKCGTAIHYILCIISTLSIVAAIAIQIPYVMFDQYKGISSFTPWKNRKITVPILKLAKKLILLIMHSAYANKSVVIALIAIGSVVDIALLSDLLLLENYYYLVIQCVEVLAVVIMLWWDLFSLLSDVIYYIGAFKRIDVYHHISTDDYSVVSGSLVYQKQKGKHIFQVICISDTCDTRKYGRICRAST
jgi:hypothetical protein